MPRIPHPIHGGGHAYYSTHLRDHVDGREVADTEPCLPSVPLGVQTNKYLYLLFI